MNIDKVLEEFVNKSKNVLGNSFVSAILYGSYARGDYNSSSDVDIMLLTTLSDEEIEKMEDDIFDIAYDYLLSDGITISVNIKNNVHFLYWVDNLPYYRNVKKEGKVLAG
ncbi:MAG: nucleotidyltransferase domain-containing protein [Pseudobutyrivibrio ruminis]|nr:nucleotidyltransferase domain-containing protein [Pseudobutyrivibrio ruminis]